MFLAGVSYKNGIDNTATKLHNKAMANNDYVGDNNPAILTFAHSNGLLPDYFLDSEQITAENTKNLYKVAFADPENRKFPCHTKAACLHSAIWYAANNMNEPEIKSGIEKLAAVHGISEDVTKVFDAFGSVIEKAAAAIKEDNEDTMEKYALSIDFEGFRGRGIENFYPINNPAEINDSADKAYKDYCKGNLPLPAFRKAAHAITKAAEEHGMLHEEIDPTVTSVGADRLPDTDFAESCLAMRKQAGVENLEPYKAILAEVVEGIEKVASSAEELIEIGEAAAEAMYKLDVSNGIVKYSNAVMDPYTMLFSGPTVDEFLKEAAQCVNLRGVHVPIVDLMNISDSKIDKMFSPGAGEIVKAAKKMLEGENSIQKCAAASTHLEQLTKEASNILLKMLAGVGWFG